MGTEVHITMFNVTRVLVWSHAAFPRHQHTRGWVLLVVGGLVVAPHGGMVRRREESWKKTCFFSTPRASFQVAPQPIKDTSNKDYSTIYAPRPRVMSTTMGVLVARGGDLHRGVQHGVLLVVK